MEILKQLLTSSAPTGKVEWIGVAAATRQAQTTPQSVQIVHGGILGDHHCRPGGSSKRQVTLIQAEHLDVVRNLVGNFDITPADLRRNLVVSGINLAALKYQTFRIGSALLRGSGNCPPCLRMEENLGPGGYAAMLNHGGITAVVIAEGTISLGDPVTAVAVNDPLSEKE